MYDISGNRLYLMGWAILFVLLYHFFGCTRNIFGDLNIGYVGVDIFLFLSGYGLTNSFRKNKWYVFYERRMKRLYPLYVLLVVVLTILKKDNSMSHIIYNLSTLSFWVEGGGSRVDWYLQSLFALCLAFPLFYKISIRIWSPFIFFIIISLCLYKFKVFFIEHWWYACLLGRIPIFMLGILFCLLESYVRYLKYFCVGGAILFLPVFLYVNPFIGISLLALPIMCILLYIRKFLHKKIAEYLKFLGTITLELYISNLVVLYLVNTYCHMTRIRVIGYIICQVFISYLLVKINHYIRIKLQ